MLQLGLLGPILAPLGANSAQLIAILAQLCGILVQLGAVFAQLGAIFPPHSLQGLSPHLGSSVPLGLFFPERGLHGM